MKNFFDGQKGRLAEEESTIFNKKGDFLRESLGVKIRGSTIYEGDGAERYLSLDVKGATDKNSKKVLVDEFSTFLSSFRRLRSVLCCGIGNPYVSCDALGERTIRYLSKERIDGLKLTLCMPYGLTGIESRRIVKSICTDEKVDLCIVIDSLSARAVDKIGTTFQFTDSGIVPGSAVGGVKAIDDEIGVPVVAIGVPTVIRGDYLGVDDERARERLFTPPNVDEIVDIASSRLANVIKQGVKRILKSKRT